MANKHSWENCLDVSGLPADKKLQVSRGLNWLEKNFPEFNEMIFEIEQGQKSGKLHKIRLIESESTVFDTANDILEIGFSPAYYLGKDLRIYQNSVNESIVHELEHAVQKTKPGYAEVRTSSLAAAAKIQPATTALAKYLSQHNVSKDKINDYFATILVALPRTLNPKILQDATYKKLSQQLVDSHRNYYATLFPGEDGAIDRANILSQLLGKSPRQEYGDSDLLYPMTQKINAPAVIYTDESLETIRSHVLKWRIPTNTPIHPLIHGEAGIKKSSIAEMQHNWEMKWNQDTKNITNDEWRLIQQAKAKYFSAETMNAMTPAKKNEADTLAEKMKKDFNKTAGNDVLSASTASDLTHHGLSTIVNKTKPKNWHLK